MNKTVLMLMLTMGVMTYAMDLSIEKAVELGLENNATMKNEKLDYENYQIQRKEAIKSALPTVTHTISVKEIEGKDTNSNYQKIGISQPLFMGGSTVIAIKNSKKYVEQGKLNLEKNQRELSQEIIELYANILKLEKNKKILENSLNQLNENYKSLDQQYKFGLITKTSLLEMKYSIIEIQSQIIEVDNNIKIMDLNLKNSIGIESNEDLEFSEISFNRISIKDINLEKDIKNTLELGVDSKMVKIGTELVKAQEDLTMASLLPKVNLVLNYENTTAQYVDLNEFNWSVGIEAQLYSFNFGSKKDSYKRSKNETEKQKNNEKLALDNIELNIKNKYYELERLEKLLEAKNEALLSAKENYNLEKEKLIAGITTTTDFLAAENRLRQSEIDIINTNIDLYVKYNDYMNTIN